MTVDQDRELPTSGVSRWRMLVGGAGLVVLLWVGTDILDAVTSTGQGPEHGPPGGTPPPAERIDDDDQTPPDDDPHDPSRFDHG